MLLLTTIAQSSIECLSFRLTEGVAAVALITEKPYSTMRAQTPNELFGLGSIKKSPDQQ
jgi:hypothetical protein